MSTKVTPSIKVVSKDNPSQVYVGFDKSEGRIVVVRKQVTHVFETNVTPEYLTDYLCEVLQNIEKEVGLEIVSSTCPGIIDLEYHRYTRIYKNDILKMMQSFVYTNVMYV